MLNKAAALADTLSLWVGRIGMALILVLVFVVFYEVLARYVLGAPTEWAYDLTYMTNGTIYLLGAGLALSKNLHVRIDFLSARLPRRVQHGVNLAFNLLLLLPLLIILSRQSVRNTYKALLTGELDPVSPWAPVIWPFYLGIALGLCCLLLQLFAETLRHGIGIADPTAVRGPDETEEH